MRSTGPNLVQNTPPCMFNKFYVLLVHWVKTRCLHFIIFSNISLFTDSPANKTDGVTVQDPIVSSGLSLVYTRTPPQQKKVDLPSWSESDQVLSCSKPLHVLERLCQVLRGSYIQSLEKEPLTKSAPHSAL